MGNWKSATTWSQLVSNLRKLAECWLMRFNRTTRKYIDMAKREMKAVADSKTWIAAFTD